MSGPLLLREPPLAWAHEAQAGALDGLGWVDPLASAPSAPDSAGAVPRFSGPPILGHLPPSVQTDAEEAAAHGQPSAWEALALVLARAWWWVSAAEHLWSPYSPSTAAQVRAVERFGVSAELHRADPSRLARLVATLPRWTPARGTLAGAELVCRALGDDAPGLQEAAPGEAAVIGRSSQTWGARPPRIGQLRIRQGRVCTADLGAPRCDELALAPGASPQQALRLLPVWTTLRLPAPPRRDP